jgi:PAS domain S-box-containing protein
MDLRTKGTISISRSFNCMVVVAAILWTGVCAGSIAYHVYDSKRHINALARETAMESVEKDLLYRYWAAGHGGIYVPVTETTKPNPYLSNIKERDITTPSGRRLTLMNPAFMTRQVHELGRGFTGVQGHITSLKPLRPENAPDAWEAQALRAIEAGAREFGEITDYEGHPHYRLMYPLYMTKPCLSCHETQGYKLGDLRGGISASIPMKTFASISRDHVLSDVKHFGALWVMGLVGASLVVPFVRRRVKEREQAEGTLRRNWEFTQSIIENEPECVKILGPGGELKFMNRAGLAMIDADSMEVVLGRPMHELVVPEHREAFIHLGERVFAGESGTLEFEIIGLKGTRRWLETHAVPLRSADGRVESLLGITRDVTERKHTEQALRVSEERLREAQHIGRIGSWEFLLANRELWWSDEVYALFGMDPAKGIDFDTYLRRVHPEDRERVRISVQDAIQQTQNSWQIEYRIVLDSGEVRHLSESATVDRDGAGTVVRRHGIVQDITERKQAEVALQERDFWVRESQRVSRLGSYILDIPSGAWTSSEILDDIFGIDGQYARSVQGWIDLVHPDDREMMVQHLAGVLAEKKRFMADYRIVRRRDRKERWVSGLGELAFDEYGKPVKMLGTIQDITERKRAEQQKEHLELQLLQSQKIESVGRLAGGIAHDINNMLTPILGYAELLAYKIPANDSRREDLAEITSAANRVKDMTQQLLAFARKQTLDIRPIDVNIVISRFGKMLRRTLRENILIKLNLAPSIGTVLADERQLEQVILNLAVNAQDAMPEGGVLMISTGDVVLDESFVETRPGSSPGKHLLIRVADTGMGMDGETLARLFEPFFTTKESGRGTGLGLATVYGIIKQHKGYIDVQSEPRQGSTFSLYLPVTEDAVESETTTEHAGLQRGAETVLVVEDQEQVLRLASLMLRESGYHVLTALSGREALEKAGSFADEIHLMISDVIMPDMNGKELFERLREIRKDIKILYMSGYPAEVISSHGVLDSGINFIRKPFSVHDFAAKVRQVLDSRGR